MGRAPLNSIVDYVGVIGREFGIEQLPQRPDVRIGESGAERLAVAGRSRGTYHNHPGLPVQGSQSK
jgi:hypothetical protein